MAGRSPQYTRHELAGLDFGKDTHGSLPDLDKWIAEINKREQYSSPTTFQPLSKLFELRSTELSLYFVSNFNSGDSDYRIYNLVAFEDWVGTNLDTWIKGHLDADDACRQLSSVITGYHAAACALFADNPEGISMMLLTFLELWIACDRVASSFYPMLVEYNCYIPMREFESPVLSYRSQLERLARAEGYMRRRQEKAQHIHSKIFQDFGAQSSFSVRFFDQSAEHQALFASIEDRTAKNRAAKRAELNQKHERYKGIDDRGRKHGMRILRVEADVCLDKALQLQPFDGSLRCFVTGFDIPRVTSATNLCAYKVPQRSSSLQQFLIRPSCAENGPPPNQMIATQDACPFDMSLDEYKSLCSMPLGINIQWENVLRQLAMPSVVFKKIETCIFILQIINQAGPPVLNSNLRVGHAILGNDPFVLKLLSEVKTAASRIKENWESAYELCALVFLTQRVASLSTSSSVEDLCLENLAYLRVIAFRWVILVRERASNTDGDAHKNDLAKQTAHLALICIATFDSEGDRIVLNKNSGLCNAIRATWAAYRTGSSWSYSPGGGNYWLVTKTGSQSPKYAGLTVHVNLLTGELLVDGRPLARLPREYEHHKSTCQGLSESSSTFLLDKSTLDP
ncbi:hypothetical protein BJX64DRAFT_292482 [Aspergillus heterothallicus]